MAGLDPAPAQDWSDALLAAALLAVAPAMIGGIVLRAGPGPVRDAWLQTARELLPVELPWRRIPLHVTESRLLGGLDLAATLRAGSPVAEQGLLSQCDGGVALLAMAERVAPVTAALLGAALDTGEVLLQREGVQGREPADLGVIALDESVLADEAVSPVLIDRLGLLVDLRHLGIRDLDGDGPAAAAIVAARELLPAVVCPEAEQQALCAAALALGIDSLRASLLAVRTARVAAALDGRVEVDEAALATAVRLVLAPRATRLPMPEVDSESEDQHTDEPAPPAEQEANTEVDDSGEASPADAQQQQPLEDRLLEAAQAAIPADLLARLQAGRAPRRGSASQGKSGALQRQRLRGRPMGTIAGDPRGGARLSLVATLRAAAPWQTLRRSQAQGANRPGLLVSREDFRVTRFRQRSQSTTIFVVDASGSAALHRLAEAKGAIELLLADCYVRRDEVALVAFRGSRAELLLPPTRSLVRAKRSLAALPGGGGTPLASAIDLTTLLVEQVQRRSGTPSYVMLTDGRANTCRDGATGRQAALDEAAVAAAGLRASGVRGMVIDTSPRPHPSAEVLARNLGALYLPLPHADAAVLRDAVQAGAA